MSVIVKLLSKFDDSGIKHAKKGFSGLTKTIGALGIGLGLKQLTDGLMDAAKAASMDQKSTQLLNTQLKKNAGATTAQTKANDKFINSLASQVGILDDDLRPAQARLARATGSVKKSQDLLKLSLDASTVSGKPLSVVSAAMAKAFTGNTGALTKLFPELKKSKDLFGDLRREVEGAAVAQASPFDRLNVAMDQLKEKLGFVVLPALTGFIDTLLKPGGAVDQAGAFFDAVANPKTDVGKAFNSIKESVKMVGKNIEALFGLMDTSGGKNPMKGFANFLQSISDIIGGISDGLTVVAGSIAKLMSGDIQGFLDLQFAEVTLGAESIRRNMSVEATKKAVNQETMQTGYGLFYPGGNSSGVNNVVFGGADTKFSNTFGAKPNKSLPAQYFNVTINNTAVDPKSATDALGKYIKQNGSLPFNLATVGKKN